MNLPDVISMSVGQQRTVWIVLLAVFNLFQTSASPLRCRRSSTSTLVGASVAEAAHQLGAQMSPRVIETQYGKLRGVLSAVSVSYPVDDADDDDDASEVPGGGLVESYLGLQYGTLLDGELRFMPPTGTLEKWDGVRVALRHRPVCPQPVIASAEQLSQDGVPLGRVEHLRRLAPHLARQAEECLNLNVYVPVTGKPFFLLKRHLFIHLTIRRTDHQLQLSDVNVIKGFSTQRPTQWHRSITNTFSHFFISSVMHT